MIIKNAKTILFAGLIAAMVLPFSGMQFATAEEQTDRQLIDEWDKTFGNQTIISLDGEKTNPPSDEIKVDMMRGLNEAKNSTNELSEADKKYYEESSSVLVTVTAIHNLIEETNDPILKEILQNTLNDMKHRMAQVGIFSPEDIDNEELSKINSEYQGIPSIDSFQSPNVVDGSVSGFSPLVSEQYQTLMWMEFACEPYICTSAKTLDYIDSDDFTFATIPVDSRVTLPNNLEFRIKVSNFDSSNWQQGYHQGIHYDSNWNYIYGETSNSDKYYPQNQFRQYTVADSINGEIGDQTYQYLYFYP